MTESFALPVQEIVLENIKICSTEKWRWAEIFDPMRTLLTALLMTLAMQVGAYGRVEGKGNVLKKS